jgi:hypothetical protein
MKPSELARVPGMEVTRATLRGWERGGAPRRR